MERFKVLLIFLRKINLIDKYGMLSKENALSPDEMTLTEENEKVKVKFIFLNISGNKNDSNRKIK